MEDHNANEQGQLNQDRLNENFEQVLGPTGKPLPIPYETMALNLPKGELLDFSKLIPETVSGTPLELEIGYGRGRFLLERARARRDIRMVGIEIKAKLAFQVQKRIERDGLTNARAYFGDVREAIARGGPDGCLDRMYLLFPDPWWKKKHTKRRVLDETFLDDAARLLRDEGELFIETDVPDRAEIMKGFIRDHARFDFVHEEMEDQNYQGRSNREYRAIEDGIPVYRFLAKKIS